MVNDKQIGNTLRTLRERQRLTQDGLAQTVGLNQFIIGRIESGQRPCRATELVNIASALGTTAAEVLSSAAGPNFSSRASEAALARDSAHRAMLDYLAAQVRAYGAQAADPAPRTPDGDLCASPNELAQWLARSSPASDAFVPANAATSVRASIAALMDSVTIVPMNPEVGSISG